MDVSISKLQHQVESTLNHRQEVASNIQLYLFDPALIDFDKKDTKVYSDFITKKNLQRFLGRINQ
ncbi:hypothetical protein ACI2OX_07755 [Bacillus sp. N9]